MFFAGVGATYVVKAQKTTKRRGSRLIFMTTTLAVPRSEPPLRSIAPHVRSNKRTDLLRVLLQPVYPIGIRLCPCREVFDG